jgi:branched-chain amino acid transport system substrate-binding protein
MKRKKWLYLAGLLVILGLVVPGCASEVEEPGELKAALIFPTSGAYASIGRTMRDATMFTINIWNDKGGVTVDGRQYKIVPVEYDSMSDPGQGAAVTTRAIELDKVQVIFGDVMSAIAVAQQPIIEKAKIPWMTAAAIEELLGPGIKYTFRTGPTLDISYDYEVKYIMENLDVKTWSILAQSDQVGLGAATAVEKYIPQYGGELLSSDMFAPGSTDFHAVLTKVKAKNPDVVIAVTGTSEVATILLQAQELGLKPKQWIISDLVYVPQLIGAVGDLASGALLYTVPDVITDERQVAKNFIAEMISREGEEAAMQLALYYSMQYDCVIRMLMAIEHVDSFDPDKICQGLKDVEWEGVMTTGSFDETGQAQIIAAMMAIQPDGTLAPHIP